MKKVRYKVLGGIEYVNGAKVPAGREVDLSEAEASFDLAQGRISLVTSTRSEKLPVVEDGTNGGN